MNNIKLIIFDLDGVLVDSKDIHFRTLNSALRDIDEKYCITYDEHITQYDGLSTQRKLSLLNKNKNLPTEHFTYIWNKKQQYTIDAIRLLTPDHRIIDILKELKKQNIKICVASNCIRETLKLFLLYKGYIEFVDYYISNEDVKYAKPSCEMFLTCMIKFGVSPKETIIVEDSYIGRQAASYSGAHVVGVNNSTELTYEKIIKVMNNIHTKNKWDAPDMNILIPMAGFGSRFEKAGYTFPKPLIPVQNMQHKPMIQVVIDNININAQYVYIIRKEHYETYNLQNFLNVLTPNCKIVLVDTVTEGAACSTLLAKEFINNDKPLLIANSDQFVEWDSNEFMYSMSSHNIDGGLLTFSNTHPKWSYVKINNLGIAEEVAEKKVISEIASVGIYYWKNGADYVKYAEQMIDKNIRTNDEFYVCPVFNEAIQDKKIIKIYNIDRMWGLGTPEDLTYFQDNYKSND